MHIMCVCLYVFMSLCDLKRIQFPPKPDGDVRIDYKFADRNVNQPTK